MEEYTDLSLCRCGLISNKYLKYYVMLPLVLLFMGISWTIHAWAPHWKASRVIHSAVATKFSSYLWGDFRQFSTRNGNFAYPQCFAIQNWSLKMKYWNEIFRNYFIRGVYNFPNNNFLTCAISKVAKGKSHGRVRLRKKFLKYLTVKENGYSQSGGGRGRKTYLEKCSEKVPSKGQALTS